MEKTIKSIFILAMMLGLCSQAYGAGPVIEVSENNIAIAVGTTKEITLTNTGNGHLNNVAANTTEATFITATVTAGDGNKIKKNNGTGTLTLTAGSTPTDIAQKITITGSPQSGTYTPCVVTVTKVTDVDMTASSTSSVEYGSSLTSVTVPSAFKWPVKWSVESADQTVATATVVDSETETKSPAIDITSVGAGTTTLTVKNASLVPCFTYTWTINVTVTKKAVTVTADDKEMDAGSELPELTYVAEDLVGDDELTGTLEVAADGELTIGEYDIVQADDWANSNYEITFEKGTLTVKPVVPTATVEAITADGYEAAVKFTAGKIGCGYDDWNAKFVLVSDADIGENEIMLGGSYEAYQSGSWIDIPFSGCTAGEEIDVLDLGNINITVSDVFNFVKEFKCGVKNIGLKNDATFTLKLVITDGETTKEICSIGELTVKKASIKITIDAGYGVSGVLKGGESVTGTLELPADATEVELKLVTDTVTIPVYKVTTNDVTTVTKKVATYAIKDGDTLTFTVVEAEQYDPMVTPTDIKQAIIDAIDETNKEALTPKIEAIVDTSATPAQDKVSAMEMAEWITQNAIDSSDMVNSDYLVASVKFDTDQPIVEEITEVEFTAVDAGMSDGFVFEFKLAIDGSEQDLTLAKEYVATCIEATGDLSTGFTQKIDKNRVDVDAETCKVTINPDPAKDAEFYRIVIPQDPE